MLSIYWVFGGIHLFSLISHDTCKIGIVCLLYKCRSLFSDQICLAPKSNFKKLFLEYQSASDELAWFSFIWKCHFFFKIHSWRVFWLNVEFWVNRFVVVVVFISTLKELPYWLPIREACGQMVFPLDVIFISGCF